MIQHAMLNYIEKYVDFGFKKLYYKKKKSVLHNGSTLS